MKMTMIKLGWSSTWVLELNGCSEKVSEVEMRLTDSREDEDEDVKDELEPIQFLGN